jgi:hypothetical protein
MTENFGKYAKFEMRIPGIGCNISNLANNGVKNHNNISCTNPLTPIRYGDEIVLQHEDWGFLTLYFSGKIEESWWYFKCQATYRNTFKLVHPCDGLTREIRIGDKVCLQLKISETENWTHKYLSGRLDSRCLKLSTKPYTWTIYNENGKVYDF